MGDDGEGGLARRAGLRIWLRFIVFYSTGYRAGMPIFCGWRGDLGGFYGVLFRIPGKVM